MTRCSRRVAQVYVSTVGRIVSRLAYSCSGRLCRLRSDVVVRPLKPYRGQVCHRILGDAWICIRDKLSKCSEGKPASVCSSMEQSTPNTAAWGHCGIHLLRPLVRLPRTRRSSPVENNREGPDMGRSACNLDPSHSCRSLRPHDCSAQNRLAYKAPT